MFRNQGVQPADGAWRGEGPLVCPRSAGCTPVLLPLDVCADGHPRPHSKLGAMSPIPGSEYVVTHLEWVDPDKALVQGSSSGICSA